MMKGLQNSDAADQRTSAWASLLATIAISSGSGASSHTIGGTMTTSARGWRGATCANHATFSSTMSHCSQYTPGTDGASSRPSADTRAAGATARPSSVRMPF